MAEARRIYVQAAAALGPQGIVREEERTPLTSDPDTDLRPLARQALGQPLRQASHFVELAALGARACLDRLGRATPAQTSVYLGSGLGEIRRTEALFEQVLPPGPGLAAPFDFINASSNMAAFYVARLAGVSARNLTVTQGPFSFEWALALAHDDLHYGVAPAALVGGVDENRHPRSEYLRRRRLRDGEVMGEGSAWLYLDTDRQGALAEVLWVMRSDDISLEPAAWARDVAGALNARRGEPVTLLIGNGVTGEQHAALAGAVPGQSCLSYLEYCGSYPTAAGFGLVRWLGLDARGLCAHVNVDSDGVTMLAGLRAAAR
jgi:hypothetical protein